MATTSSTPMHKASLSLCLSLSLSLYRKHKTTAQLWAAATLAFASLYHSGHGAQCTKHWHV
jgi:hypothetical protein